MIDDTIAAIATGMTDAGVGIIRVSGEDSIDIVDKIFRSPSGVSLNDAAGYTIHYGHIYDDDIILDEVLVSIFRAPGSFTGETTCEINCHGGMYILNKTLELVIKNGCRLAEPGEFTKRAFLNGKLDLTKAESVMDLIASKNDFALKNSMKNLKGDIYKCILNLRERILYEIAHIESAIDDPEHFDMTDYPDYLRGVIKVINDEIKRLIINARDGRILKDGILTVIVGKPNAGKSSFLNLLSGNDRAIVTSKAGTTRDVLEESVRLGSYVLNLVDTAGIRETEDEIESIGVDKAREYIERADLVLYMVDSSVALDDNDRDIAALLNDKKTIVLMNKSDLDAVVTTDMICNMLGYNTYIVNISAKENTGIDDFKNTVDLLFGNESFNFNDEVVITNTRQINELNKADESLRNVIESIDNGMPEDFYSIDLKDAYEHLGFIIGEEIDDDVADEIFSKFCMGK